MNTKHAHAIINVVRSKKTGLRTACVYRDRHAEWDKPSPVYNLTDASLARIERISDEKHTVRDIEYVDTYYE